jgi:hypothetical protein
MEEPPGPGFGKIRPELIGIPGKKKERIYTPHRPLFETLRVPERVEL